jgi:hypothetical protein
MPMGLRYALYLWEARRRIRTGKPTLEYHPPTPAPPAFATRRAARNAGVVPCSALKARTRADTSGVPALDEARERQRTGVGLLLLADRRRVRPPATARRCFSSGTIAGLSAAVSYAHAADSEP